MKIQKTIIALSFSALLSPITGSAGEPASGQNYMVLENQSWPTSDNSGFYHFNGYGIASVISGPTETSTLECHGSGFWSPEGNRAHGICIHGTGDDTFTSTYLEEPGAGMGSWQILGGTGIYSGISGKGTFKPDRLPGDRAISSWQGEISLAE